MTSPIRPTDDEARDLAKHLMHTAKFGALACTWENAPMVTRVAVAWVKGELLSLVSELSVHTQALRANPTLSLLMGEPGEKGDPLTYPRLTLFGTAQIVEHKTEAFAAMRAPYLREYPKAKLYIDFTDFVFLQVKPTAAHLNGGFGRAFHLTPEDLI